MNEIKRLIKRRALLGSGSLLALGGLAWKFGPQWLKLRPDQLPRPPSKQELTGMVSESFGVSGAPGMVFSLYSGSALEFELALGFADQEKSRPITRQDHFWIASVTKSFMGYLILKLSDYGKIDLHAPISDHLKNMPEGDRITALMLANHTSGIANLAGNKRLQKALEKEPRSVFLRKDISPFIQEMSSKGEPGEDFRYSNTNTILLGDIVEAVTGLTWHEALSEYVLEPLDLSNTGFQANGKRPFPHPRGYRYADANSPFRYGDAWLDVSEWNPSWGGASGALYSTEADLARLTRALGRGEGLTPKSRKILSTWHSTDDWHLSYGFHVWHYLGAMITLGDIHGSSAFTAYVHEYDMTLVVLSNLSNSLSGHSVAHTVGEQILDRIYGVG